MPMSERFKRSRLPTSLFSSSSQAPLRVAIVLHGFALAHLARMVLSGGVDYCYSDIGCFPLSAEFYHPQYRPFNVRPWHRDLIKTQFELFNRQHPEGFMMLPWNRRNLIDSGFNPKLETKIIIPGWLDNINRALWVRKLKDSLLWLWAPVNVIVVRWRNFTPYTISTANTRVVGAELANILKFIEAELNYDRAYYHIIGHSLGAHIAGYCGDRIYGLGRITALDPARPFFQGMPKSVRLDRGDAKFVDAIHSDFTPENAIFLLMSFGMTTPVGHLDFYPNGPPLFQPGCLRDSLTSVQDGISKGLKHNSLSVAFLESIRYLTACDHQRSHEWFIESITNRECAFVGVRCNEFEGMINGRCTCDDSPSACAIMGIHADQMYMNNIHEELWPIRAGSIDYKYKSGRPRPPIVVPRSRPMPPPPRPPMGAFHLPSSGLKAAASEASTMRPFGFQVPMAAEISEHAGPIDGAYLALGNYRLHSHAQMTSQEPTRETIYASLKQQASELQKGQEPSILDELYQASGAATISYTDEVPPTMEAENLDAQASEQVFEQHAAALDDIAFVQYLKMSLLTDEPGLERVDLNAQRRNEANSTRRNDTQIGVGSSIQRANMMRRDSSALGHPDQYDGHPLLLSNLNRDIEGWYEDNSKWFLKTNNRPSYCSNQYQLMIFLGPLRTSSGRDSLRANLLVSIIGSRGQLLKQRFVPRGSALSSFTMQPFFILLEGSYSLGQIRSVAIAWEARNDPDPVKATIKFQSGVLEKVGSHVPAYQTKNNPWMPETMKYDRSAAFKFLGERPSAPTSGSDYWRRRSSAAHLDGDRLQPARGKLYSTHKSYRGRKQVLRSPRQELFPAESSQVSMKQCYKTKSGNRAGTLNADKARLSKRMNLDYVLGLADTNLNADFDEADQVEVNDESLRQWAASSQASRRPLSHHEARKPPRLLMPPHSPAQQVNMISHQIHPMPMDQAAPAESMFVPLIDLPLPGDRIRAASLSAALGDLEHASGEKLSIDIHNIDTNHDVQVEDSIVINKVVVSPLQAYYGHHGITAKTFCPPNSKRKLWRNKTVRLTPAFMGKCY